MLSQRILASQLTFFPSFYLLKSYMRLSSRAYILRKPCLTPSFDLIETVRTSPLLSSDRENAFRTNITLKASWNYTISSLIKTIFISKCYAVLWPSVRQRFRVLYFVATAFFHIKCTHCRITATVAVTFVPILTNCFSRQLFLINTSLK